MQEAEEVQEQTQEIPQGGSRNEGANIPRRRSGEDTRRSTAVDGMGLEELFDLLRGRRQEEYEEPIPRERGDVRKRRAKR